MNADYLVRKKRMAAFTGADVHTLAEGLASVVSDPQYDFLRRPESGLVMVRGRIGGDGRAFNMGEILVSRCAVQYGGYLGHGWVLGKNLKHAELAALGDALGQEPGHAEAIDRLVAALEAEKEKSRAAKAAEVKKTQVQFFTLVRGEDEE